MVQFVETLKLLGVTLDSRTHVPYTCITSLLTTDDAKMTASAIIGGRLDYCNSLLYGCSARNLDKLHNQLAHVDLRLPWSESATNAGRQLHWLPIEQRIVCITATITFRARQLSGFSRHIFTVSFRNTVGTVRVRHGICVRMLEYCSDIMSALSSLSVLFQLQHLLFGIRPIG